MRNKKIFCLILCFLILFNFSYSYAEKAQDVNLDSSLFTPKRLSNGQRRFYYNGRFLRDGEFYVIDSKDSSWNGAYSFDEDGFWEESVQIDDSSDLIRVKGGSWKQEDGGWRYVSDQDSVNAVEDDTIEENYKNEISSVPDNRISDMSHIVRNWELDDKNSENRVFILRDNVECFIDGIENIKQGSDYPLKFNDDDIAASGNSSINTHITTYPQGSNKIKVGVIDTYFIKNHSLLKNNIKSYYDSIRKKEINNESELEFNPYRDKDQLGMALHGTHVAGIIAQVAPKAELYVASIGVWKKNINNVIEPSWDIQKFANGIDWLVSKGCKVINISLGLLSDDSEQVMNNIFKKYKDRNDLIFICALGNFSKNVNNDSEARQYPACLTKSYNNVISVVNIRMDGEYSKSSNIDPSFKFADVGAPGEQIYSSFSYKKGDVSSMTYLSGTSMSSPFVAGAVCRMLENNPNLTSSQIKQKLRSCGKFIDFNKLK